MKMKQERGNYRALRLLEHMMRIFERMIEKKSEKWWVQAKCGLDLCLKEELYMPLLLYVSYRRNILEKRKTFTSSL